MKRDVIQFLRENGKKRILIVGWPGSGKSTLARGISKELGLPHLEVDKFYWDGKKGAASRSSFANDLASRLAEESWIVEGHYLKIRDFLPKPDAIVILRPRAPVVYARLLRRDLFEMLLGRQKTSDLIFVLKNSVRLTRQRDNVASDWLDTPVLVL